MLRPHVLRRPPGHARHLRRIGGRGRPDRGPSGEVGPEHRARDRGQRARGTSASGPRTRRPTTRRIHVARTFATLDHLSGGRAAWNVVTSVNDGEAQNYGLKEHLGHDARYDRADEFLEATTGLWDSWDDDALVLDRETPLFAHPEKVHELNYEGEWFNVRGPLTVPRTPQGRPVLMQAGSSGRGREFAARWAELIFTGDPGIDIARAHYKDQKEKIGEQGRRPRLHQDVPDGLHRRRGVQGPRRGARAALLERPRRPHGLAHAALRTHELRLLRALARRARSRTSSSSPCQASGAWCRTSRRTSGATR